MSISKFREVMEHSGCRWVLAVLFALIAAAFVLPYSCGPTQGGPQLSNSAGSAVAKVGEYPVTEKAIWDMAEQSLSQAMQQFSGQLPPGIQATFVGSAIEQQINAGILVKLAEQKGVNLDDDAILNATDIAIAEEIANRKQQMIATGKIKADVTDAVFESIHEKEYGMKTAAFREQVLKQYGDALKMPDQRNQLVVQAANTLIMDKLMEEVPATDETAKAFYDLYLCKRIFLKQDAHPGEDLIKKANDIKAEIAKGLKFEEAMDKYTDDPPGQNKKKRDNEFQLDGKTAALNEAYAPITKQKPGEVGGPYSLGDQGVSLVVFNTKTNSAPADFEQNKAKYIKEFKRDSAAGKLQEELKKLKSGDLVKWESPAYHAMYDYVTFEQSEEGRSLDPKGKKARYEELLKRIQEAKEDPLGARIVPIASFAIFNAIWGQSTEAEKAALGERRIEVLTSVLQQMENSELRMELADILATKKDGAGVTESLKLAASAISSDFGPNGQRIFSDIQSRLLKFKSANVMTAAQEKEVRDLLDTWKKDKAMADKYEAEQKAKDEADRKAYEAEQKKKAEQEKAEKAKSGK